MTQEELSKLSAEEKRVMIAEACRWNMVSETRAFPPKSIIDQWREVMPNLIAVNHMEIPDYLNSLDAIHEAEKIFAPEQMAIYVGNLNRTTPLGGWMIVATAAQRADAFLLSI